MRSTRATTRVTAGTAAALAGCVLALSTGCARAPEEPAPRASSPADVCASLVSYWVKEALKGSKWAGLDWEQKGLSNEQYEIHDEVLLAARAEERRAGRDAAFALADRESRRRCEEAKGATGSSENWRPPSEQRVPTGGL
ncbi:MULTISPECIES: hypothetical protein [unclassified Streptomyces]|uniref:hypothetical protein n=1 Tax=unclassified Streptomyces TaxID=2593676 RepID=UPI002E32E898|nr:hypothetical protein [Streptomyces sp. NBC_01268]